MLGVSKSRFQCHFFNYPNSEHEDLVHELTAIAIEEMEHFKMVIDIIKERGYTLGRASVKTIT